jgi:hypothetical protein
VSWWRAGERNVQDCRRKREGSLRGGGVADKEDGVCGAAGRLLFLRVFMLRTNSTRFAIIFSLAVGNHKEYLTFLF